MTANGATRRGYGRSRALDCQVRHPSLQDPSSPSRSCSRPACLPSVGRLEVAAQGRCCVAVVAPPRPCAQRSTSSSSSEAESRQENAMMALPLCLLLRNAPPSKSAARSLPGRISNRKQTPPRHKDGRTNLPGARARVSQTLFLRLPYFNRLQQTPPHRERCSLTLTAAALSRVWRHHCMRAAAGGGEASQWQLQCPSFPRRAPRCSQRRR